MNPVESNTRNAAIELEHILLELKHGRTQHMRHFIDQYFCYKNNYVNRNGNADWERILDSEHASEAAARIIKKREKDYRKLITKEHVVPVYEIREMLKGLMGEPISADKIARKLDKYVVFAAISKDEDEKLRNNGLNNKMPEGWAPGDNLFARYDHPSIDIKVKKMADWQL